MLVSSADRRFGAGVLWSRHLVCDQPDLPVLGVLRSARLTAGSCWRADGGAL